MNLALLKKKRSFWRSTIFDHLPPCGFVYFINVIKTPLYFFFLGTTLYWYQNITHDRTIPISIYPLMYCIPCMSSAALKPLTIISVSIEQEEPHQFLKQICSFGDIRLFLATVHTEQNLFLTPMYNNFLALY